MNKTIESIAGTHLGKTGVYSDQYDPTLLVALPRQLNRDTYKIDPKKLPFTGYDVWNCYEVSILTTKGQPVSGMFKITYSAESEFHVESKSLKLYLNSFNMTRMGTTRDQASTVMTGMVKKDLEDLLRTPVQVVFYSSTKNGYSRGSNPFSFEALSKQVLGNIDDLEFDHYSGLESSIVYDTSLTFAPTYPVHVSFESDLLRSNCRVTNQPDWGNVYVNMKGYTGVVMESVAKYLVSHRKLNHFHEEVCEMIFVDFMEAFNPVELTVACLYTRRGGIDINPIRTTHIGNIPREFVDPNMRIEKTLRQ